MEDKELGKVGSLAEMMKRWNDGAEEINTIEDEETIRRRKDFAFENQLKQKEFYRIGIKQKEKVWTENNGRCSYCRKPESELFFGYDIHPSIRDILSCMSCAKKMNLIGKKIERSRVISSDVKRAVWDRDEGMCVTCKSTTYLEYDHVIPFSKGGSNSIENIQILCRSCNLAKGANIE